MNDILYSVYRMLNKYLSYLKEEIKWAKSLADKILLKVHCLNVIIISQRNEHI